MTVLEILAILFVSMLVFSPFVLIFNPRIKNKLLSKNKNDNTNSISTKDADTKSDNKN